MAKKTTRTTTKSADGAALLAALSPEQESALRDYCKACDQEGIKDWRRKLRNDWTRACSDIFSADRWSHLQRIRNTLGPDWLSKMPKDLPARARPDARAVRLIAIANLAKQLADSAGDLDWQRVRKHATYKEARASGLVSDEDCLDVAADAISGGIYGPMGGIRGECTPPGMSEHVQEMLDRQDVRGGRRAISASELPEQPLVSFDGEGTTEAITTTVACLLSEGIRFEISVCAEPDPDSPRMFDLRVRAKDADAVRDAIAAANGDLDSVGGAS